MTRTGIFVQAGLSHLGENSKSSPDFYSSSHSGEELSFWATNNLAQERRSRLSENSWKLGGSLLELSLKREILALSEEQSRSSEEVSPKRELAEPPMLSIGSLA